MGTSVVQTVYSVYSSCLPRHGFTFYAYLVTIGGAQFDKTDIGTKHLIVSRLIERVDVSTGYKVDIKFKISLK